jgi:monoamine oxidase
VTRSEPRRRVVVLGAGLAGLCAAHQLVRGGFDVVVLEAQNRPGGRVQTVREGFAGGGFAEAGAVRIPDSHVHTNRYLAEFGLTDKLFEYPDTGHQLWYLDGESFATPRPPGTWSVAQMSDDERRDPHAGFARYLGPAVAAAGDVFSPRWPDLDGETRALDGLTLAQLARRNGASEGWLRFLRASQGNLGSFNALAFAGQETAMAGAKAVYGLRGGNDQLPAAFAAALGGRVRYRAEVLRVDSLPDRVVVGYRDAAGRCHELEADHGVCTIPFPVLRRVRLTGLGEVKMLAIETYRMADAAKVYFQTRNRFWHDGRSGAAGGLNLVGTDTAAQRIWDISPGQPGPFGMLCAYLIADSSALGSVPPEERADHMLAEIVRFLPELAGNVVASYVKVWAEDPFAGGCCALAEPGQLRWLLPAARSPDHRLHFAGEHTSPMVAWMDGALESGERAAAEITTAGAGGR